MKIFLLSCTSKKMSSPCEAMQMYSASPIFQKTYAYAKEEADKILILSAKHGVLEERTIIEPYNLTLNNQSVAYRKEWAKKVTEQLQEFCELESDEFIILTGVKYYEYFVSELVNYSTPLKGKKLGQWIPELNRLLGGREPTIGHDNEKRILDTRGNGQRTITQKSSKTNQVTSYINELKEYAWSSGSKYIDLISGEIHKDLQLKKAMPTVCNAMYKCMKENDEVFMTTLSGKSSTIKIRYYNSRG